MGTELQTAQIKFWVRQKVDLTSVEAWMEMNEPTLRKQKYALYEHGLDPATQDTLFSHEEVMRTYTEIAGQEISNADKLLELKAWHTKDALALALVAVKDMKDE
uniref:RxLR effector candidate protein n=1 Tax=Hyaloperonospora arabidopsidis (strain Emoy2) TaxID=559515 RepID=M4B2X4_HYAAE